MKIKVVVLVLFIFSCYESKSQTKGFLGKKNEISFDIFGYAYNSFIGLNYKRSIGTNSSIIISYSAFNNKGEINDGYTFGFFPKKSVVSKGDYESKGINWSLAFLYSNPNTGMGMPIGYYMGWGFDYLRSTVKINNTYNLSLSDSTNYTHKEYRINFLFGKDTYLTNNFIIDATIISGLEFGTMNNEDVYHDLFIAETGSSIVYPRRGQIMLGDTYKDKYFSFFIFFQLKIGYLF